MALWIGWRLFGKPAKKTAPALAIAPCAPSPGQDSPFYRIEQNLAAEGWQRTSNETMREWLRRVGPHLSQRRDDLAALLQLHYPPPV